MLLAQNMEGYHSRALHDEAMAVLRQTRDITQAVSYYRARDGKKQALKRVLLRASALLPGGLRARLRKANSSRKLR